MIAAASVVAVIATGTAAAAANFGLLGTNDKQVPAGHLDLATVNANARLETATTASGTIRVELQDDMIHIFQADGTEITVPLPTTTSDQTTTVAASTVPSTGSDDDQPEPSATSPSTTARRSTATTPSASTPHHDDSNEPAEQTEPGEHDDD